MVLNKWQKVILGVLFIVIVGLGVWHLFLYQKFIDFGYQKVSDPLQGLSQGQLIVDDFARVNKVSVTNQAIVNNLTSAASVNIVANDFNLNLEAVQPEVLSQKNNFFLYYNDKVQSFGIKYLDSYDQLRWLCLDNPDCSYKERWFKYHTTSNNLVITRNTLINSEKYKNNLYKQKQDGEYRIMIKGEPEYDLTNQSNQTIGIKWDENKSVVLSLDSEAAIADSSGSVKKEQFWQRIEDKTLKGIEGRCQTDKCQILDNLTIW